MKKTSHLEVNKMTLTAFSLFLYIFSYGQTDSTSIGGFVGLRGMWQTGNLDQLSLMPNGKIGLTHPKHYAEVLGTYHYIKVGDFEAKNDLWLYSLYQYTPNNLFYLSANVVSGFAVSYRIDHSIVAGVGGGVNIIKNSPRKYFQFHLYGSYLDFQFVGEKALQSFALGSLLRANIPINQWFNFQWELGSYHAMKETSFWGSGNLLQLVFNLSKNFSLNISHQTYYNHQTASNIEKTNTQMLFGFQYSFSNIHQ